MVDGDYYEVLGVPRDADGNALKSAYRKRAMQYHPDRNPGDEVAEQKFKALGEAYDCLRDPQKRAAYDRYGKAAFQNGGFGGGHGRQDFGDFADIFDNIFGDFMSGGRRGARQQQSRAVRGGDLRYDMELTLEEAFTGTEKSIEIDVAVKCESCQGSGAAADAEVQNCATCGGIGQVRVRQGMFVIERTCPGCHGAGRVVSQPCEDCLGAGRVDEVKTLQVKIPAGVDHGTRIRLSGEGEAGARGGPPGDLYIFVHLLPHEMFEREGTDLHVTVPIGLAAAALGGKIDVPSIDGEPAELTLPAGTQGGKQFRRRGRGMPGINGGGRGDLVIEVETETPVRLSKRQRELLEEYRSLEVEAGSCPKSASFFTRLRDKWDELAG